MRWLVLFSLREREGMVHQVGLERDSNQQIPSVVSAWERARTLIGTLSLGAFWREVAELVALWPALPPELRTGILTLARAAKRP